MTISDTVKQGQPGAGDNRVGKALPDPFTPDDARSGGGPRFCQRGSEVNAIAIWTKKLRPVVGNHPHAGHQEGGREQASEKGGPK